MRAATDKRAAVGAVMGGSLGYAFGSSERWSWIIAFVIILIGLYSLEKMDDSIADEDADDFEEE